MSLTRTYTFANMANTSTYNQTKTVTIDKFTISGDEDSYVGVVNSLKITHWHSAQGSPSYQWQLYTLITLNSGKVLRSDTVSHSCNNAVVQWENTFTGVNAEDIQIDGIQSMSIGIANTNIPSKSNLFWRAVREGPIQIILDFDTKIPDAPTIDSCGFSGKNSTFDVYFSGVSSLVFTSSVSVDSDINPSIQSKVLTLTGTNYSKTINITNLSTGSVSQTIGKISCTGTINWTFVVTDSLGGTDSESGTIEQVAYTKPQITSFSAERYEDLYGVLTKTNTGVNVWFNINAKISSINYNSTTNSGTLKMYYRINDTDSWTLISTFATLNNGATYSTSEDTTIDTSTRYANTRYTYRLVLADRVSSVESIFIVPEATGIMNIERNGVSFGKLVEDGTVLSPVLDCNMIAEFRKAMTLMGILKLTSGVSYGQTLPNTAEEGQVFFLIS